MKVVSQCLLKMLPFPIFVVYNEEKIANGEEVWLVASSAVAEIRLSEGWAEEIRELEKQAAFDKAIRQSRL